MPQTRHEAVEFADNLFFNDLCESVVQGGIILLAGAPGSNKSTVSRQLILDRAKPEHNAAMWNNGTVRTEHPSDQHSVCATTIRFRSMNRRKYDGKAGTLAPCAALQNVLDGS